MAPSDGSEILSFIGWCITFGLFVGIFTRLGDIRAGVRAQAEIARKQAETIDEWLRAQKAKSHRARNQESGNGAESRQGRVARWYRA